MAGEDLKTKISFLKRKFPNLNSVLEALEDFYNEYNKQRPIIDKKLKIAKGNKKQRIEEFSNDLEKLRENSDKLKDMLLHGSKLSKLKFIMIGSKKRQIEAIRMIRKYKKEDCDIDNFEV